MALYRVIAAFGAFKAATTDGERTILRARKNAAIHAWPDALEQIETRRMLVAVFGDTNLNNALLSFRKSSCDAYDSITTDLPMEQFNKLMENVGRYDRESIAAVRVALGIKAESDTEQ